MTDWYVENKKAVKASVHFMGECFVWFEFELEDGTKVQTMPLRGEI